MTTDTIPAKKNYSKLLKKILIAAGFLAVGFALSRIELIRGLAPFGPAFIAACFLAKRQETLLGAAGVILGALLHTEPLFIIAVSLLVCSGILVINKSSKKRWITMTITAASYLIAAAILRTENVLEFMTSMLECLFCLVMIYVFQTLVTLVFSHKKRTILSNEERISIVLGLFVLVTMFGTLNIAGVYIANIIALLLAICVAYSTGAAFGAGVGLCLGIACCVGAAAEVMMVGMLGICGLVAGTLRRLKKPGTSISFFLATILYIVAFYSRTIWLLVMIEAGAAAVLFMAVPNKVFTFVGKYADTKTRKMAEYRMHGQRFKELTSDRLSEVSEVFRETGEMFAGEMQGLTEQDKNISGVLSIVASSTCKSCVFKKSCWDKDFINTYNVFSKLFTTYEEKNTIEPTDIPKTFAKKCYNTDGIISAAQSVFGAYLLNLQWKKKIQESRQITGRQLKGVAEVVSSLGSQIDTGFKFLGAVENRVAAMLEQTGVSIREVCAEQSAGSGISVGVQVKGTVKVKSAKTLETAVSDACGVAMKKVTTKEQGVMRFEQTKRFNISTGIAALAKDRVSGDSYLFREISESRYLIMLCDGMGSGEEARKQSNAAISLAEKFFKAGFEDSVIFDTINKLMMLKGSDEVFSTMDLCMLDLNTGTAKFTKVGAECSYIIGKSGVTTIKPGALPIGILEEISPALTRKKLSDGDIIVMLSDGVADAIEEPISDWFSEISQGSEKQIADAILKKACGEDKAADDMTVLVSKITSI